MKNKVQARCNRKKAWRNGRFLERKDVTKWKILEDIKRWYQTEQWASSFLRLGGRNRPCTAGFCLQGVFGGQKRSIEDCQIHARSWRGIRIGLMSFGLTSLLVFLISPTCWECLDRLLLSFSVIRFMICFTLSSSLLHSWSERVVVCFKSSAVSWTKFLKMIEKPKIEKESYFEIFAVPLNSGQSISDIVIHFPICSFSLLICPALGILDA